MPVALSSPDPERIPGFSFSCRLSPEGPFTFDAPPVELELLYESSSDQLNELLLSSRLAALAGDGSDLWTSLRDSAATLTPFAGDHCVRGLRTGRERWVRVSALPRREADGTVVWNGLIIDITELKSVDARLREAVEELARSQARMRAALDGADMIGWDLDLVTNRLETTVDMFDFLPRGQESSNPGVVLSAVHPDDVEKVLAGRLRAIETGEPMHYDFRGRVPAPDGSVRWFTTRGQVLRDSDGKPLRLVAVTTEVTERKRAEAERESLNSQLLDTQKWESLGVLAGGVAHDFNNILTVVLGSAGLARKGLPPFNSAAQHLDQIEQACRRAADLCRQLLAYAGRGHIAAGKTDLNQLIRNSAALLGVPASKSAAVRFELADGLPLVTADAAPIRQVLVNLVTNAAEALGDDEGDVVVETRLVEVGPGPTAGYHLPPPPGRYVRLTVSDTGPGISTQVQARMFDPFFTTKFAGRGLGLAAVLGIMRAHHGAICVTTSTGKGTAVEVLWPVIAVELPAMPTPLGRALPGKALIVDDEMYVREVTASTLQELGYEPLLAGEGTSALNLFRANREQLRVAVIDIVMPGMSGYQLLQELRALDPGLPAVLVSGFIDRRVVGAGAGAHTEFVQKPFHPEELIAAVRRVTGAL